PDSRGVRRRAAVRGPAGERVARRRERGGLRAPGRGDRRRHRAEQRGGKGAGTAELSHRAGRQRQAPRAPVRDAVGPRPPAARAGGHRGGGRVKRRRKPRPKRAAKLAARRLPVNGSAVAASAVGPSRGLSRDSPGGDVEPLADSGLRPLLERYCRLAAVKQAALGPDHAELSVPPGERPFFRGRASLRVAFSLDALERDPDAEIAVLGSPFLSQLIEAIRARGARLSLGLIAPALPAPSDPGDVELTIPLRDGTARLGATRSAVHPAGRLSARVVLRAGAGVEEAVVESDVYDLSAGVRLSDDLVAAFRDLEAGRVAPADPSVAAAAARIPARQPTELLELLLAHLRDQSAERRAARPALAQPAPAAQPGWSD